MSVGKGCFVTVGATASFDQLVAATLSVDFISSLEKSNFTHLVIQYGKSGQKFFSSCLKKAENGFGGKIPLNIQGIDFQMGDFQDFVGDIVSGSNGGLLIAHAGTGSLMDGMSLKVPTILVPNPSLAGNHQLELAEEFEKAGYCVHGDIRNLSSAVMKVESQTKQHITSSNVSIWTVLDQEMGFTDRELD